jgi:membrane protein
LILAKARRFIRLLIQAVLRHNIVDLGAQLAYWSLLALIPFVIFVLTLIGYLPLEKLDVQLMTWLAPFMPDAALRLVWETVHEIVGQQRGGLLALSLVGALWSAAGGASAMQVALNRAYGCTETRAYWRRKTEALLVTLAATFLLGIALVCATVGPDVIHFVLEHLSVGSAFDGLANAWSWIRWPISVVALVVLLAATYQYLPAEHHGVDFGSIGSIAAVVGWMLVTWGFRVFVQLFHAYARSYGALAAVVMLMTWIYLSGMSFILGAEVNAIIARMKIETRDAPMT